MADSGEERERELAELLHEVRALRQSIDRLQESWAASPALGPEYAVLVRAAPELGPNYEVLARAGSEPPVHGEAPELRPDYQVLARAAEPALPPEYQVLARGASPEGEERPASDS